MRVNLIKHLLTGSSMTHPYTAASWPETRDILQRDSGPRLQAFTPTHAYMLFSLLHSGSLAKILRASLPMASCRVWRTVLSASPGVYLKNRIFKEEVFLLIYYSISYSLLLYVFFSIYFSGRRGNSILDHKGRGGGNSRWANSFKH